MAMPLGMPFSHARARNSFYHHILNQMRSVGLSAPVSQIMVMAWGKQDGPLLPPRWHPPRGSDRSAKICPSGCELKAQDLPGIESSPPVVFFVVDSLTCGGKNARTTNRKHKEKRHEN